MLGCAKSLSFSTWTVSILLMSPQEEAWMSLSERPPTQQVLGCLVPLAGWQTQLPEKGTRIPFLLSSAAWTETEPWSPSHLVYFSRTAPDGHFSTPAFLDTDVEVRNTSRETFIFPMCPRCPAQSVTSDTLDILHWKNIMSYILQEKNKWFIHELTHSLEMSVPIEAHLSGILWKEE